MARANRLRKEDGGIYHVTHRCHNRAVLLKFARDRNGWRSKFAAASVLAVGSSAFLEQIEPEMVSLREIEVLEVGENVWALRETALPYGIE